MHKMDNETFKEVENFIAEHQAKVQFTPADIHRTNIAEAMLSYMEEPFYGCQVRRTPFFLHGKLVQNDRTVRHHFKHDAIMYYQPSSVSIQNNGRNVFF